MRGSGWVFDPHRGGSKVSPIVQRETKARLLAYAEKKYKGKYLRLDIRYKGAFCYIDAYQEPSVPKDWKPSPELKETREQYMERLRNTPIHLVRLRYLAGHQKWSVAFYSYSSETYQPSVFDSGEFLGTPEEGLDLGAVYLEN